MPRTWQEYMAFPRFLLVHTYQQGVHLWDHLLPLWPPLIIIIIIIIIIIVLMSHIEVCCQPVV